MTANMKARFDRACKAADAILGPMTGKFGRLMEEAPNFEITVSMGGYSVLIPAKAFNALYDATDRGEP